MSKPMIEMTTRASISVKPRGVEPPEGARRGDDSCRWQCYHDPYSRPERETVGSSWNSA